ncbi:MAG: enoyl-CoA hydratase/isomerase family protein [Chloroflexi bacterium]|nr:enoyl-CoA hydratase/isomerase family protein [Chloroflexota bacterium]
MNTETLICQRVGPIATLNLKRVDEINAIDDSAVAELSATLNKLETDIDVKVVIFRASGDSFCDGADPGGKNSDQVLDTDRARRAAPFHDLLEAEMRRMKWWQYLFNFPRVTIAEVQGRCQGSGLYLAMCTDITVASEDAVFGDPSAATGLLTATPLWSYIVGIKKAKDILFTGRHANAAEAAQLGLVSKVVPRSELHAEAERFARAVCLSPGDGLVFAKESLRGAMDARGLGAAWRMLAEMRVLNTLQHRSDAFPRDHKYSETGRQKKDMVT